MNLQPLTLFAWGFIISIIIYLVVLTLRSGLIKYIKTQIILSLAVFVGFAGAFISNVYSNGFDDQDINQLMILSSLLAVQLLALILNLIKLLIAKTANEQHQTDS